MGESGIVVGSMVAGFSAIALVAFLLVKNQQPELDTDTPKNFVSQFNKTVRDEESWGGKSRKKRVRFNKNIVSKRR
jgi:hypothetical protein